MLLVAQLVGFGADWWSAAGAVAVSATFSWALAARTGGRPLVFGALALLVGLGAVTLDLPWLSTGAAVITAVIGAVLAVMATVPARRFRQAAREALLALGIGATGALAAIGFEPPIDVQRWEYVTLALAQALAQVLVYRHGAGLHGMGRRGALMVLGGGALLIGSIAYAELVRRYGSPALEQGIRDVVRWSYDHLGAFPRPLQSVLGFPALVWGCHQRARRRQGWWVCAFGVTATISPAQLLADPRFTLTEIGLVELYSLVLGLLLGYVLIRIDLRLTGSRGTGARRAEVETAIRPEPPRFASL